MFYLAIKAALSGVIIAIVSEVAQRRPGLGALLRQLLIELVGTAAIGVSLDDDGPFLCLQRLGHTSQLLLGDRQKLRLSRAEQHGAGQRQHQTALLFFQCPELFEDDDEA